MANQSVLGTPSVPAPGSREGFSLNKGFTFTCGAGMLLPVHKQFLNIGERVSGRPEFFARTEPLLAPSMSDIDVYVDLFFVPMRHIFSMFEDWFTQVDDVKSALWNQSSWKNSLPVIGGLTHTTSPTLNAFNWMTNDVFDTIDWYSNLPDDFPPGLDWLTFASTFGFGCHRLVQHLGYNAQALFCNPAGGDWYFDYNTYSAYDSIMDDFATAAMNTSQSPFSPYYFCAYQKVYYDYYRDSNFENNDVLCYNLDRPFNSGEQRFIPSDQANANAHYGMFQLRYRNRSKDYFTAVHPSPLFNSIGMLPNAQANLSRVHNWLMNSSDSLGSPGNSVDFGNAAEVEFGDAFDDMSVDSTSTYRKQDESGIGSGSPAFANSQLVNSNGQNAFHSHDLDLDALSQLLNASSLNTTSLACLRTAFAMDKTLRIANRAGKHVDDQIYAEFGYKVPQGVSGEVYKIKSYHSLFHIGEVVQSATTVDSSGKDVPLGELAGRGVSLLNGQEEFEFTAPCHGIFMAIFSVAPRYKYVFTQEKDGMKTYIEDFFRKSYDNQGMQPLCDYELGLDSQSVSGVWQYRYMEDKIKYDSASMVFATHGKNPWSFVAPARKPFVTTQYSRGWSWEKVLPVDTNNLFVAQFQSHVGYPTSGSPVDIFSIYRAHTPAEFLTVYLRDPFTVDFNLNCKKVSQMSTFGEPSLGGI